MRVRQRVIVLVAAIAVLAVTLEAVVWMAANPLPSYWDEAGYYASTVHNTRLLRHFGLSRFGVAWNFDPFRPPINVILPLPVSLVFQNSLLAMRLVSFAGFLAAALLAAFTVQRVTRSRESAALALMMLFASPILVQSTKMLGTEYPLLLAIAGVLFFGFATQHRFAWIGLGLAIGLGLLAKTSFVVILVPLLVPVEDRRPRLSGQAGRLSSTGFAVLLGLLIASTWWIHNVATAIRFVLSSRKVVAHSLGPPWELHTFVRWCEAFARCVSGYGILAVIVIVVAFAQWRTIPRAFVLATSSSAFLLLIAGYSGTNHNPRWLAPAVFLLIVAAAAMASRLMPVLVALVVVQIIAMTAFHKSTIVQSYVWRGVTEVMSPVEQWDFHPVKLFVDRTTHIQIPRIAVMGAGYQLNPANVEEAWLRDGVDALSRLVWREDYTLPNAVAYAASAQVVITAPEFRGDPTDAQPRVNGHNAEFARALTASGLFAGPFDIDVGVNEPARVAVFLRR